MRAQVLWIWVLFASVVNLKGAIPNVVSYSHRGVYCVPYEGHSVTLISVQVSVRDTGCCARARHPAPTQLPSRSLTGARHGRRHCWRCCVCPPVCG